MLMYRFCANDNSSTTALFLVYQLKRAFCLLCSSKLLIGLCNMEILCAGLTQAKEE